MAVSGSLTLSIKHDLGQASVQLSPSPGHVNGRSPDGWSLLFQPQWLQVENEGREVAAEPQELLTPIETPGAASCDARWRSVSWGKMNHPVRAAPAPEVPSQPHSSLLLLSDLTWEREGPKERERTPGFVEEASRCALSCKDGAGSEERTLLTAKTSSHTASSLLPRGFVKVALGSTRLADP